MVYVTGVVYSSLASLMSCTTTSLLLHMTSFIMGAMYCYFSVLCPKKNPLKNHLILPMVYDMRLKLKAQQINI